MNLQKTYVPNNDDLCQINKKLAFDLKNYLFYRQIQNINALYEVISNSKHKTLHDQIDDFATQLDYSSRTNKSDILLIDKLKYNSSWQSASEIMIENLTQEDASPTEWIKTFIPQQKNIVSREISTQTDTQFEKKSIGIQSNLSNSIGRTNDENQTNINSKCKMNQIAVIPNIPINTQKADSSKVKYDIEVENYYEKLNECLPRQETSVNYSKTFSTKHYQDVHSNKNRPKHEEYRYKNSAQHPNL